MRTLLPILTGCSIFSPLHYILKEKKIAQFYNPIIIFPYNFHANIYYLRNLKYYHILCFMSISFSENFDFFIIMVFRKTYQWFFKKTSFFIMKSFQKNISMVFQENFVLYYEEFSEKHICCLFQ